ncbi:hypothetical protein [Maridesulfovibrio sp.]|uniref:hypothetical protein n=1 Tax=unclassified Maridesulfovibrio TaxID=2794999 RepID=UPI003B00D2E8
MISAGLKDLNLDLALQAARREILFFAPPYGNFRKSELISSALEAALAVPHGPSLKVFCLPRLDEFAWSRELMELLRPGMGFEELEGELKDSREFISDLAKRFPGRVEAYELRARPNLPVLIVDDDIFFGHFAHSTVQTPAGFWSKQEAPVEDLFIRVQSGVEPTLAKDKASFRIIAECAYLMGQAVELVFHHDVKNEV